MFRSISVPNFLNAKRRPGRRQGDPHIFQCADSAEERAKMLSPEEEDEAAAQVAPVVAFLWCFDQTLSVCCQLYRVTAGTEEAGRNECAL